jgi:RIO-like serine/threonine protein kinase
MYKIFPNKIIGYGSQGHIFLTCKKTKEFCNCVTKIPVTDLEIEVSKIMSEEKIKGSTLGPKVYEIFEYKNKKDLKNIIIDGKVFPKNITINSGKCMIMEKLEGKDLAHVVEDPNVYIDRKICNLIIRKIRKMHKLGWHHGDLYAQNIFVIFNKNKIIDIKIIDFGNVKSLKYINYIEDFKDLLNTVKRFGKYNLDNIQELINTLEEEVEIRKKKDIKRLIQKINRKKN